MPLTETEIREVDRLGPARRACTVLYHHRTQARDGQRVHVREVQEALRRRGHRVIEIAPVPAREAAGAPASGWRGRVSGWVAGACPRAVWELLQWGYNGYAAARLARAVRRERPDFIYERYALNTVAGAWTARRFGLPLLLEVNSPLAREERELGRTVFDAVARHLERYTLRRADAVLVVSDVLKEIVTRTADLDPQRVVVIRNGVRPALFDAAMRRRREVRAAHGIDDRVVLGAAAFFLPWHGIDRLVSWVERHAEVRHRVAVLLVGEGPAVPALRAQVARAELQPIVRFLGDVPHDQLPDLVAAMDVVVLPRATPYASPLKLFEYMAAGRAIVAARQPNLAEVLTDGVDALLVDPDETSALDAALRRVVEEPLLRARLGSAARDTIARKRYTWDDNADRIVDAYARVVGSRQ